MVEDDSTNIDKTIEYKIDSINIIKHSQINFSNYGLKSSDIKNGECQIGMNIKIEADKSCISFPMIVAMFLVHEGKQYELFSTEAIYTYKIKKFRSLFMTDDPNNYNIPDLFMRTLIGTALSGMRGIMFALTTITEYKRLILPLIPTSKILEEVKKAQSKMKAQTNNNDTSMTK